MLGDVTAIVEDEEEWVFDLLGLHDTLQGPWLTLVGFEYPIPVSTGTDADVDAVDEGCRVVLQPHVQRVAAIHTYLQHARSTQLSTATTTTGQQQQ